MSTPESEPEPQEAPDEFLSRWSRRKQQARQAGAEKPAVQPAPDNDKAPLLPPIEELGIDSDYRGFLHPKVDEGLRRAALKKLFSDPHFNVMDGLDTYIDDYSVTEPIPPEMMAGLKHAQSILTHARERRETEAARVAEEQRKTAIAAAPDVSPAPAADAGVVPDPLPVPGLPDDGAQTA